MFEELDVLFPPEIVGLVLCFEGRIYHGFVRDFCESVYSHAYRRCFRNFTFKRCLAKTRTLQAAAPKKIERKSYVCPPPP